ncbi:plasmid pRiA4b ORF-3 family protein [Parafrankia discariae]|uniref:plasmid pRiA4b ORF-3 family protein n=1 Tax=Parafrankia discariae TaxID=365528 RepID=UPI00035C2F0B|nr:plasmid pRiA4b ORF-3 family protein [Parafrankia discariae]
MAIYQIRVELRDTESPQWLRLLVPPSITLHDLNKVTQESMAPHNSQFYSFTVSRRSSYGPKNFMMVDPDNLEFDDREVTLALAIPRPNLRISHMSDPREGIYHNIILQKVVPEIPGLRYPHCVAGVEEGQKIDPDDVNKVLAELDLSSLSSEPAPASREIARRIKHRRREGAKPPALLAVQLFHLTETVKDRPALAVRNAALLLMDTVWAVLTAHAVEPAKDDDLSMLLDEAVRLAGVEDALRGAGNVGPFTLASVLGISPDLAALHAGVKDSDAQRAVDAAFVWCRPLLDTLPEARMAG